MGAAMPITKLEQIVETVKSRPRKRLIAAWANDSHTIAAVGQAVSLGLVEGTLVGDEATIRSVCKSEGLDPAMFTCVQESSDTNAAARAVAMVNAGEAQILMKGLVSSDKYMRAILHKEKGLMDPGAILSHVTVMEVERYPKLIVCGDVAVLPAPELKEKIAITRYQIAVAHALGIEQPKVAIIAATEQMLYKMQACVDAAIIAKMADRGDIKGALVDGPLALDVAVDPEAVAIKGLKSAVAGDADCLVFPNIESGNVFYKTCTKLAGAELAGLVVGARVPCVLTSRGDSSKSKLYSIALAALTVR
jgi:phosphate butyryltransferase